MTAQDWFWVYGGIALGAALLAGVADWLRTHRRRNLDNPGWVPWRGLQVAALFTACMFAAIAFHGGI
jgi:hypothetical protein